MKQISTLEEAEKTLAAYMPQVKELLGKDLTLDRMQPLLDVLGHPETKLKIIHIAGTSGKTSTCYYIASLLVQAGQKVGMTVSPHVDSITERVQINLQPLSNREFCDSIAEFLDLISTVKPQPTYFELLIAFVYWYFANANVDYAVIETGLGGTFDATNIAQSPNKICVITDIGFDHMHVLGNTLREIASQKAGIIHPGNQVFMYDQGAEINKIFKTKVQQQNATLHQLTEQNERSKTNTPALDHLPLYQQRNWLLANRVYGFVAERDGLSILTSQQLADSMDIQVPGRMDLRKIGDKLLIMDGAHNQQKMQAFVGSFQAKYPNQKAAILLSSKSNKEYQDILPLLLPICERLIITTFKTNQDMPVYSLAAEVLATEAQRLSFPNVAIMTNAGKAYQKLLEAPEDLLVITGSFYLLSVVRPVI